MFWPRSRIHQIINIRYRQFVDMRLKPIFTGLSDLKSSSPLAVDFMLSVT